MAGEVSKKILWIFVFLILAAIAILGVLFIRGYQSGKEVSAVESSTEPEATQESTTELTLTLTDPAQDIATTSARYTVMGKTTPSAYVAITGGTEDAIVVATSDGSFSSPITLAEGVNTITAQVYNDAGDTKSAKHTILYAKSL